MTYQQPNLNLVKIEEVRDELQNWRASNGAPKPIPADIWAKAVRLATFLGVGRVSQALHLDHGSLKKRVQRAGMNQHAPPSPTFIELLAPPSCVIGQAVVELETTRGTKLRIELAAVSATTLGTLLKDLGA